MIKAILDNPKRAKATSNAHRKGGRAPARGLLDPPQQQLQQKSPEQQRIMAICCAHPLSSLQQVLFETGESRPLCDEDLQVHVHVCHDAGSLYGRK